MIDLHSHILPGLDDGPDDLAGSLRMARDAAADGIRAVAATPHVRADFPTRPDEMERGVAALREAIRAEGIPLELVPGGEIALDRLQDLDGEERHRFGLAGNPEYLLVETPYFGWPAWLAPRVLGLAATGVTPVLAHPERNREVQAEPELLRPLVEGGTLVQLTASSIDERGSRGARRCSQVLLEYGLAHLIASDAHEPHIRRIGLSRAAAAVGDAALARWLTEGVPGAILSGEPIPERPVGALRG